VVSDRRQALEFCAFNVLSYQLVQGWLDKGEGESGEEREEYWVLVGDLKERDHLEDLDVDERLLQWALEK